MYVKGMKRPWKSSKDHPGKPFNKIERQLKLLNSRMDTLRHRQDESDDENIVSPGWPFLNYLNNEHATNLKSCGGS